MKYFNSFHLQYFPQFRIFMKYFYCQTWRGKCRHSPLRRTGRVAGRSPACSSGLTDRRRPPAASSCRARPGWCRACWRRPREGEAARTAGPASASSVLGPAGCSRASSQWRGTSRPQTDFPTSGGAPGQCRRLGRETINNRTATFSFLKFWPYSFPSTT